MKTLPTIFHSHGSPMMALGAAGANARIVRELKNETDRALSLDGYAFAKAL